MAAQTEFDKFLCCHTNALLGYATRLKGNAQEAEDLVIETFERAWQAWEKFPRKGDAEQERRWLFVTCKHLFLDGWRARKRELRWAGTEIRLDARNPDTGASAGQLIAGTHDTEEEALVQEYIECLEAALEAATLPAVAIETFRISYHGGGKQIEIAEKLHISQVNVTRYLKKVRDYIVECCGDPRFS